MGKDSRKAQSFSKSNSGHGSGFTGIRKKKAINSYKKILRKEHREEDLYEVIKRQKAQKEGKKTDTYANVNKAVENKRRKAEEERQRKQQEKELRIKEQEEARAAAAERRKQRQKLFSKKTRKGQPYLHNQMTFLLEKIERTAKKESQKGSVAAASNT